MLVLVRLISHSLSVHICLPLLEILIRLLRSVKKSPNCDDLVFGADQVGYRVRFSNPLNSDMKLTGAL